MSNEIERAVSNKTNKEYLSYYVIKNVKKYRPYWPNIVFSILILGALAVLFTLPLIGISGQREAYTYYFTFLDLMVGRHDNLNADLMNFNIFYVAITVLILVGAISLIANRRGNRLVVWISFLCLIFGFFGVLLSVSELFYGLSFTDKALGVFFQEVDNRREFILGVALPTGPVGLGYIIGAPLLFVLSFSPFICDLIGYNTAISRFKKSVKVGKKLINY